MNDLQIDVRTDAGAGVDDPRPIAIRSGDIVLTRLQRPGEERPDDYLIAPPAQLAFWLTDNWWRLRWECVPPEGMTLEWRLAHELSSIGGGYAWPRVAMWGEGERVGIVSRCDPPGVVGPVRFLTDTLKFISASAYEQAVDRFLETVSDERAGYGSDRTSLRSLFDTLKAERDNPDIDAWRRVEAKLGFDPDEAPEALMQKIADLTSHYGREGVEEAMMAAPGGLAPTILEREIAAAKTSRWECDFSSAIEAAGTLRHMPTDPPWTTAERVAKAVRQSLSIDAGPLRNKRLAELLGVRRGAFDSLSPSANHDILYGLRLNSKDGRKDIIALRSRWAHDRRFEFTRALADKIWAKTDRLGPLAKSKTARQKFQRAFAQSLLCPFEDLMAYLNTEHPSEEDITAAAHHFHVSERVVQTVLVNKYVIPRENLPREDLADMVEAA